MNKVLLMISAAGALAAVTPAAGQSTSATATSNTNFSNRIVQLDTRLQTGISAGTIDRTEASGLRTDLSALKRLDRQYGRNGYTEGEREDLQARIRELRSDLRMADGGQRGRYANWDRQWDSEDGTSYTGVGGPVETGVACQAQTGIGGILSGVLGRATGNVDTECGLEVGQRVPGNLIAVPSLYRNQYRDGNGVYYRADGQYVYQIDTRNHVVMQVFPMSR